jgi:RimJ/RimL family protein N-acetyltransferase
MRIETAHLRLRLYSRQELLAKFEGIPEVSPDWIARVRNSTAPDPWTYGYEVLLKPEGVSIGSVGFKGPPDSDGMVEIAYSIEPAYQGRGYATEAAQGLVNFALADQRVRLVRAHTKTDHRASIRVLEKCNFESAGEVMDAEDGLVLRFERAVRSIDRRSL